MPAPSSYYISRLNVNGQSYVIRDADAQSQIEEIKEAIAGGITFRGRTTTEITDGEGVKTLHIVNGSMEYDVTADKQEPGYMYIYNDGNTNLEFVVVNNAQGNKIYSELGSTGALGDLAFADTAAGSVTLPLAASISADNYDHVTGLGTVAVTYTEGSLSTSEAEAAADIGTTATGADVTYTDTAASVTYTATGVTAAGPTVSLTYTTDTFTALQDVTYDSDSQTLSISSVTSSAFATGARVESVGNIAITYAMVSAVTYAKVSGVTYDKTTAVTYDKVSASGTFLTGASLAGALAVTNAAPTLTITNPTISVTVSPVTGS